MAALQTDPALQHQFNRVSESLNELALSTRAGAGTAEGDL